ncbi:MAG: hypothetical protein R2864_11520 [Syntrophotaleaceae bacterium]
MMPDSFSGDKKALWGRIATLGWLIRLRALEQGISLRGLHDGGNAGRRVVPLMFQFTGRPLLDLVEDFSRPELFLPGISVYDHQVHPRELSGASAIAARLE